MEQKDIWAKRDTSFIFEWSEEKRSETCLRNRRMFENQQVALLESLLNDFAWQCSSEARAKKHVNEMWSEVAKKAKKSENFACKYFLFLVSLELQLLHLKSIKRKAFFIILFPIAFSLWWFLVLFLELYKYAEKKLAHIGLRKKAEF